MLPWQTRWIAKDFFVQGEVFEYGRLSLYCFDIVLLALLIIYVIQIKAKSSKFKVPMFFICLALVIYSLLSTLWAKEQLVALYWGMRMLGGFVLFYLIQKIGFSKARLAIVVVMAGAIQGLLAAWQFLTQALLHRLLQNI